MLLINITWTVSAICCILSDLKGKRLIFSIRGAFPEAKYNGKFCHYQHDLTELATILANDAFGECSRVIVYYAGTSFTN